MVLVLYLLGTLAVFLLIKKILTARRHRRTARSLSCPDPPPPFVPCADPFGLSNLFEMAAADREQRLPNWMMAQHRAYEMRHRPRHIGTQRVLSIPGTWNLFTVDPENLKAILAVQFKDFALGEARNGNFRPMLGEGIFATDGAKWEHSRALLRPQFARDQVSDLTMTERHVQHLMEVLDSRTPPGSDWTHQIDLLPLFFNLTMDSATEFLFGESAGSQSELIPGATKKDQNRNVDFGKAFDQVQGHLAGTGRLADLYWLGHNAKLRALCKQVHSYVDYYVNIALETPRDEKDSHSDGKYVFLRALAQETQDPIELRDQLLNILLAGRDTTASLLGWVFFLLSEPENKPILAKLRATVIDQFGTYEAPKAITFGSLKSCTYLQWTLNETLRLYPIVPLNTRRSMVDTSLPRGGGPEGKDPVYVPAGKQVTYSVHVLHRREDLWGPDADLFRPERWDGRKPGWEYLPFNGGPRICLGQQFALTEAGYVVVRLLQRYREFEGVGRGGEVKHKLTIINQPGDGTKVRLEVDRG